LQDRAPAIPWHHHWFLWQESLSPRPSPVTLLRHPRRHRRYKRARPSLSPAFPCRVHVRLRRYGIPNAAQTGCQDAKSTNALHGDQISTAQAGVAKSVVSRDTRAEKRGGFGGLEFIRNRTDAARLGDHHFRIPSIRGYSRYHRVLTIHGVSAPARFAYPVFSGNEADSNPLTNFPFGHSAAQDFNPADDFMSRNTRQSQAGVSAGDRGRIGVTDSTCFHPNPNLARVQELFVRPREGCLTPKPRPPYMSLPFESHVTFCISSDALSLKVVKLRFDHVCRAPQ
jgi:hypothetical protein